MKSYLVKFLWFFWGNESRIKFYRKKGAKIGNNCDISRNVQLGTEPYLISIGNNVRITQSVKFITHDGGLWVLRNLKKVPYNADKFGKIKIGNNVNIGWNCLIFPNVTIGDNVIIGAGAVVTKDVPSNSIAAGVPAKVIETIDEYYNKNKNSIFLTKGMNFDKKRKYLEKNIR